MSDFVINMHNPLDIIFSPTSCLCSYRSGHVERKPKKHPFKERWKRPKDGRYILRKNSKVHFFSHFSKSSESELFNFNFFKKKKKLFTLWYMNRQQLFTVALSSYRSTSRVFSSFVYVSIANSCLSHIYGLRHDNTRHENTERVFFCTESYGIRVQLYRVNQKSM